MSSLRIILILAGIAGIAICGFGSSVVSSEMVEEVNRLLPEEERFAPAGWYYTKTARLLSDHARLFPKSGLREKRRRLMLAGTLCLMVSGLALVIR